MGGIFLCRVNSTSKFALIQWRKGARDVVSFDCLLWDAHYQALTITNSQTIAAGLGGDSNKESHPFRPE